MRMKGAKQINIFGILIKGCDGSEVLLEMNFNGYHSFLRIFGEFNALISSFTKPHEPMSPIT